MILDGLMPEHALRYHLNQRRAFPYGFFCANLRHNVVAHTGS